MGISYIINNNDTSLTGQTIIGNLTISGSVSASTYLNIGTSPSSELWVSDSIGNFSIIANNDSGLDSTGNYAYAEGSDTTASGGAAHAEA